MRTLKSAVTSLIIKPKPPPPGNWMYFKGNGHLAGRNGAYDHVDVQRFFYIPTVESGVDSLKWVNGFSLCWQLIPVKQAAYYTTFFYSAWKGTDFYDLRDTNGYVGAHPYPFSAFGQPDGDDYRLHKWEVSVDGGDAVSSQVAYGEAHTQAFRCEVVDRASGRSQLRFYTSLNGLSASGQPKNEVTHGGAYANAPPHAFKAMVFGDAPWWLAHQHERLSGYIRRIKIFAGELPDDDLVKEAASDALVTDAGRNLIWWAKVNAADPNDLTSDFASVSGVKRSAHWVDDARCEIVTAAQLPTHHAFVNANTVGNLQHLERG